MLIRGIELELHANEDLSNHIRREGDFFEAEILDYIRDNFPRHETILDIGANIGNHSVYFANFLEYESLVAFEPLASNYDLLKRNMAPYNNVGLVELAVGERSGPAKMNANSSNSGAGEVTELGEISIGMTTLDRIHFDHVTLIKIDVEWYEPQVLDGAQDTIYRCHPLILIEDAKREYAKLLPEYDCIKAWDHHKTYLYQWKS